MLLWHPRAMRTCSPPITMPDRLSLLAFESSRRTSKVSSVMVLHLAVPQSIWSSPTQPLHNQRKRQMCKKDGDKADQLCGRFHVLWAYEHPILGNHKIASLLDVRSFHLSKARIVRYPRPTLTPRIGTKAGTTTKRRDHPNADLLERS